MSSGPRAKATPSLPTTNRTTTKRDQAELIQLVLELAASTGKTTLVAINQAGCRRDQGFCSKQFGTQRIITTLRGLGVLRRVSGEEFEGCRTGLRGATKDSFLCISGKAIYWKGSVHCLPGSQL